MDNYVINITKYLLHQVLFLNYVEVTNCVEWITICLKIFPLILFDLFFSCLKETRQNAFLFRVIKLRRVTIEFTIDKIL